MGMTPNQLFWRIELPLAVPEIIAGLRIATVSTVAIATLAVFAGAGGLGGEFTTQIDFKTNVIFASLICVTMAIMLDVMPADPPGVPSRRGGRRSTHRRRRRA